MNRSCALGIEGGYWDLLPNGNIFRKWQTLSQAAILTEPSEPGLLTKEINRGFCFTRGNTGNIQSALNYMTEK
jgi:hypothetical protein